MEEGFEERGWVGGWVGEGQGGEVGGLGLGVRGKELYDVGVVG